MSGGGRCLDCGHEFVHDTCFGALKVFVELVQVIERQQVSGLVLTHG